MSGDTTSPAETTLPTDHCELAEILRATDPHVGGGWLAIEQRLAAQLCDRSRALAVFERAEAMVLHERGIESARNDLRRAIAAALSDVHVALGALDGLNGEAWDVEYAEGGDADMRAFLADAARALRAAAALNPVQS